jgi:hypothetical protein
VESHISRKTSEMWGTRPWLLVEKRLPRDDGLVVFGK